MRVMLPSLSSFVFFFALNRHHKTPKSLVTITTVILMTSRRHFWLMTILMIIKRNERLGESYAPDSCRRQQSFFAAVRSQYDVICDANSLSLPIRTSFVFCVSLFFLFLALSFIFYFHFFLCMNLSWHRFRKAGEMDMIEVGKKLS